MSPLGRGRGKPRPLKVVLLGRTKPRRSKGGIARSAKMIRESLTAFGDVVDLRGAHMPVEPIPRGTHVVIHYADVEMMREHIEAAAAAQAPILINSSYDGTDERIAWMRRSLRNWHKIYSGVFLFCFSEAARNDYRLYDIRDRLVVLPKTIRRIRGPKRTFQQRSGICLGELEKSRRSRIVSGLGAQKAVDAIHQALPGVPLCFYNQYAPRGKERGPNGATVEPYRQEGFIDWLGRFRLFVCLSRHETFGMVPAEAQAAGTVVLYRHQPQSLDEQLGQTAFGFDTEEELAMGCRVLYGNEKLWKSYSRSGVYNAASKSGNAIGSRMDLALRKTIVRWRSMQRGRS